MSASIRKAIGELQIPSPLGCVKRRSLATRVLTGGTYHRAAEYTRPYTEKFLNRTSHSRRVSESHMRATELENWDPKPEAEEERERDGATITVTDKLSLLKTRRTRLTLAGHNIGWDIAFLTKAFLHPLPDSLGEFVRTVDTMFPRLLDTRALSANQTANFKDISLSAVYSAPLTEGQGPRCYWEPGMGYRDGSAHDAGYDNMCPVTNMPSHGRMANLYGIA